MNEERAQSDGMAKPFFGSSGAGTFAPSRGGSLGRCLERGFTFVELVAVIAIVGVLAAIAVYSLRKYIQYSKTAEAGEIISAIKAGEEAYFDETFRYLSADKNDAVAYYPADPAEADGTIKIQWGGDTAGTCDDCAARYRALGVLPSAPVLFRYVTVAGNSGGNPSSAHPSMTTVPLAGANPATAPYYVVTASSDLDSDGAPYTHFLGSSFQGDLYSENIGR